MISIKSSVSSITPVTVTLHIRAVGVLYGYGGYPPYTYIYLISSLLFAVIVYVLRIIYMSRITLSLYASIALLLHVPFDCPLVSGWSNPLTWAVGLVVGVTAAVVTD